MATQNVTEKTTSNIFNLDRNQRISFTIRTIILTTVMTSTIYLLPNYYGLEAITTHASNFVLWIFGFSTRFYVFEEPISSLSKFDRLMYFFYDDNRATYPAISMKIGSFRIFNFLIVRSCTGMQAGALLLGLIWSTPANIHDRIRASYSMLIALFIGNVLRIAAIIALTAIFVENFQLDYETTWKYAHDILGRPIGFFGTIGFVALIESKKVRILDTISIWMDVITGK